MKEFDLEYKIIGKDKTVLVIETGIGSSFYDWYSIVEAYSIFRIGLK